MSKESMFPKTSANVPMPTCKPVKIEINHDSIKQISKDMKPEIDALYAFRRIQELLECLIDEIMVEMKPSERTVELLEYYKNNYSFVNDFLEDYYKRNDY